MHKRIFVATHKPLAGTLAVLLLGGAFSFSPAQRGGKQKDISEMTPEEKRRRIEELEAQWGRRHIEALEEAQRRKVAEEQERAAARNRVTGEDLNAIIEQQERLMERMSCAVREGSLHNSDRCADVMYTLGALYYDQDRDNFAAASERYAEELRQWERSRQGQRPTPPVPDYSKSLQMFWQLTRKYPRFSKLPEALHLMAGTYWLFTSKLDSAIIVYDQIVSQFPNSQRVHMSYFQLSRFAFAADMPYVGRYFLSKVNKANLPPDIANIVENPDEMEQDAKTRYAQLPPADHARMREAMTTIGAKYKRHLEPAERQAMLAQEAAERQAPFEPEITERRATFERNHIGYGGFPWGTPIEIVSAVHPNLKETVNGNLRSLRQNNVGGGIRIRDFIFHHDKLIAVDVSYNDMHIDDVDLLVEKISSIYGVLKKNRHTGGNNEAIQLLNNAVNRENREKGLRERAEITAIEYVWEYHRNQRVELDYLEMKLTGMESQADSIAQNLMLRAMRGVPVTVRYLDPILYERAEADNLNLQKQREAERIQKRRDALGL